MARIDYYKYDNIITENDVLLGSSYVTTGPNGPEYETSRYTIGALGAYFSTFLYQGGEAFNIPELEGRISTNESNISLLASGLSTTNNNVYLLSSRVSNNEDEIAIINSKLVDVVNDIIVTDGYAEYVRSVTIPDGVTDIEDNFMVGEKVKSLALNNGLVTIGANAFYNNKIFSLTIPGTVTTIKNNAFQSNRIDSLSVPESVTLIGERAFMANEDITSVSINGQCSIGVESFAGSYIHIITKKGLASLYIADGCTISPNSFNRTYYGGYNSYYVSGRVTTSQVLANKPITSDYQSYTNAVDKSHENEPGAASIPNTNIPEFSFVACHFSSVVIRDDNSDPISIGAGAFALNTQLSSFTFKSNITSIGNHSFGATAFETLDLSALTSTTFESYCFSSMYRLSSVILPANITMSQNMFTSTPKLLSIDWGNITNIPYAAFSNKWGPFRDSSEEWRNVFTVQIPSSVTTIDGQAFSNAGIEHLTIPSSVTSLGAGSFTSQKRAIVDSFSVPSLFGINYDLDNTFFHRDLVPSGIPIVKRGLKTLTFEAGSSLTSIGGSAFSFNELTTVDLPESVNFVDGSAFWGNKLSSFTWNNTSSVDLGYGVFAYNEITDISGFLPNGVWRGNRLGTYDEYLIPSNFFKGNLLSGTITIPANISRISPYAFTENNITTANVPTGCVVDSGAFDPGVNIVYY